MRILLLFAACVILSGCLGIGRKEKVAAVEPEVVTADCYTVDLFTKAKVEKPADSVPEPYRAFLGSWGKGAWNDVWCHDLLITKVQPDGQVELFEMHAPYAPWGQPATAFRRTARIDPEGNLRFAYGTETVSYQMVDGKLEGSRHGRLGNLHVSLVRRGVPPVPMPRFAGRTAPQEAPETILAAAPAAPAAASPAAGQAVATRASAAQYFPEQPAHTVPIPVPRAGATQPDAVAPSRAADMPPVPLPRPDHAVRPQAQAAAMVMPGS